MKMELENNEKFIRDYLVKIGDAKKNIREKKDIFKMNF
jgi:hypothetical protein